MDYRASAPASGPGLVGRVGRRNLPPGKGGEEEVSRSRYVAPYVRIKARRLGHLADAAPAAKVWLP